MSGRNHGPPTPMKGLPPRRGLPAPTMHDSHFARGLGPMQAHPSLLDEFRESHFGGMDPRRLPPHPAFIEEGLAAQHQEIHGLLADNQRLAATHVALKQELEVAQHELQRMAHFADTFHLEKDSQMRELFDKSSRLDVDLHGVEALRNEVHHVRSDVKELSDVKQELTSRMQVMSLDLARYNADFQRVPALKAEIESMKQELQRARAAIEYEKKGYAENYEHGAAMEKKLIAMARELEKLRAEIANSDKRGHPATAAAAASAVGNPGAAYGNYGNPEVGHVGHRYPGGYGMAPAQANNESFPQYVAGPVTWGTYDPQRCQGHR